MKPPAEENKLNWPGLDGGGEEEEEEEERRGEMTPLNRQDAQSFPLGWYHSI